MKSLDFGVEIETLGQTRDKVAQAIQSVVGGTVLHVGTPFCYDPWEVIAADGRTWKVVADSSLSAPKHLQAEVVSPILRYQDIETLQQVIRAIRTQAMARVDDSAGIHIHCTAAPFDAKSIRNLVKMVNKQEDLLMAALNVNERRRERWCRGVDQDFLERIERQAPKTMDEMNRAWYGYYNPNPMHYDSTRYYVPSDVM